MFERGRALASRCPRTVSKRRTYVDGKVRSTDRSILGRPFEGHPFAGNFFAETTDSQTKWLIVATVPGFERNPIKKLDAHPGSGAQAVALLAQRTIEAGREVLRIVVADGGCARRLLVGALAPCALCRSFCYTSLEGRGSREYRLAKPDRLDTELLMRGFLGSLRGEYAQ